MKNNFYFMKEFFNNRKSYFYLVFSIIFGAFSLIIGFLQNISFYYIFLYILVILIWPIYFIGDYFFNVKVRKYFFNFKNDRVNLKLVYGNILKSKNWKVISIDEDKNWAINDEIVSINTINGKYLKMIEENENVNLESYFPKLEEKDEGQTKFNNLVDFKRKIIFVPLTKFDKNNQAHTNYIKYIDVLLNLLDRIDSISSNSDFVFEIPILGLSDKSRGLELKEIEIINLLISLIKVHPFISKNLKINLVKYKE